MNNTAIVVLAAFFLSGTAAAADPLFDPIPNYYPDGTEGSYCENIELLESDRDTVPQIVAAAKKYAETEIGRLYAEHTDVPARTIPPETERWLIAAFALSHWYGLEGMNHDFHVVYSGLFWTQSFSDKNIKYLKDIFQDPCHPALLS